MQALIRDLLNKSGYSVDVASTKAETRSMMRVVAYDLIILDLGLPDGDALDILHEMRNCGMTVPVLVTTARATIEDRVGVLDRGADDFLGKPFHQLELLARVRALLRRPAPDTRRIRKGEVELDCATGEISIEGRRIFLRSKERSVLATLLHARGGVVSKAAMLERDTDPGVVSENAIEAIVYRLRKALADRDCKVSVETIRGLGYRLIEQDRTAGLHVAALRE